MKIAEAIDAKVLVVTKYGGDFSESLMPRMSEVFGERLVGYIVNGLTKYGKIIIPKPAPLVAIPVTIGSFFVKY